MPFPYDFPFNFEVEEVLAVINDLAKRLTTPYRSDPDSNNYKLLSIVAEQKDDINDVGVNVGKAANVEQATGISLDRLGELIACFRHTDEQDNLYRNRLRDYLHSLIGGGTHEQLEHTIEAAIPGITDADYDVIDGYGVSAHGDPNHFAHIKVRIRLGFDWVMNNLYEMLDRARAACITIDEFGPLAEEILTLTETIVFTPGYYITESMTLLETVNNDLDLGSIDETLNLLEPRAGSLCHYCDITQVDSINYLCS